MNWYASAVFDKLFLRENEGLTGSFMTGSLIKESKRVENYVENDSNTILSKWRETIMQEPLT